MAKKQATISGTVSAGAKNCSQMAAAINASPNPAAPETNAAAKAPAAMMAISGPIEQKYQAGGDGDAGADGDGDLRAFARADEFQRQKTQPAGQVRRQ